MNWFLVALKNSFDFKGRARRREYGWLMLGTALISLCIDILESAANALLLLELSFVISLIGAALTLIFFVPQISVTTRRLHDLGYSGWWQLLPAGMAILFLLYLFFTHSFHEVVPPMYIVIGVLYSIFILAISLFLLFKDGQKHPNKYGESPKYPSETTDIVVSKTL